MKKPHAKSTAKQVLVVVSGSVVMRCNTCGQIVSEAFKLNGGTVECPYCKSQYLYQVKLRATQTIKNTA